MKQLTEMKVTALNKSDTASNIISPSYHVDHENKEPSSYLGSNSESNTNLDKAKNPKNNNQ